ncbi:hypothetical protein ATHL_00705, partial [Anaerolinea thermolimosa]
MRRPSHSSIVGEPNADPNPNLYPFSNFHPYP